MLLIPKDIAEQKQYLKMLGATLDKQSESGSQYWSLPDGKKARVSDHAPNAATKNWMETHDVADLRTEDIAGIVAFAPTPTEAAPVEKPPKKDNLEEISRKRESLMEMISKIGLTITFPRMILGAAWLLLTGDEGNIHSEYDPAKGDLKTLLQRN